MKSKGKSNEAKIELPIVEDTKAIARHHLESFEWVWRKDIVMNEPKKEKLRDIMKPWNKEGLSLNMIFGTGFPRIVS